MEQNLPLMAKKVWSVMRVMFIMLKKGISKAKLIADLNIMMKRGKLAGKSLHNLLFHHHHNWAAATIPRRHPHHLPAFPKSPSTDDEFSCTTTPQHPKHQNNAPAPSRSVIMALEMLTTAAASPVVKQLRVTDSPFPLSNGDENGEVDEDAEKFITWFRRRNGLIREK